MTMMPKRSTGVLLAELADRVLAYDLRTETAHHLNRTAGVLLASCDGSTSLDALVADWARQTGADPAVVAAQAAEGLEALARHGLVGAHDPITEPTPPTGSTREAASDAVVGAAHPVIDWSIAFRGSQPDLVARIDAHLGTGGTASGGAPLVFDVCEQADGQIHLQTDHEWLFPTSEGFFTQLTSVVNEYAVWTHSCVALHAGGVRSPDGQVVVLPAPSGSGKSTLVATFVAGGWDYLGDEAIGVRPDGVAVGYPKRLAVDPAALVAIGLRPSAGDDLDPAALRREVRRLADDVGTVDRVVLPTYEAGASLAVERLDPVAAVEALLANTLNLARAGQEALDALCHLAATVPVHRVVHGDARLVVDAVAGLSD